MSDPKVWACEIDDVWPSVRAKAMRWLDKVDGGEADLLAECREKRAFCFRSHEAFMVLSLAPNPDGTRDLYLRLGVSFGASSRAFEHHEAFLHQVARDLGARRIRFRSPRPGWLRALGDRWTVAHIEYQTDVRP